MAARYRRTNVHERGPAREAAHFINHVKNVDGA
jgi:hypothetical protein